MNNYTGAEIAIIGMSGRFPGAGDLTVFWENLRDGKESVSRFTDEEILQEGPEPDLANPAYVRANAFLHGKDTFDAAFFGYLPSEAALMDPQTRLFHEECWKALEDAGIDVNRNKEKVGLFAGGSVNLNWSNYAYLANRESMVESFAAAQLRDVSFMCSRVAFLLNLQGPSIFMNTACSTSLVAVQRACMSLLLRECRVALAGGVHINNYSCKGYVHREGMIFSKDGHCRAFDENAGGTIGGEGVGVVVLKKLQDALNDGDHIHAIIAGSGINNDGADKISYTAPGVEGQYQAILKALKMAKVAPESISYVETHGTGTPLGDPIEVEALKLAFGKSSDAWCALGAVKTNIGHLDTAAGVAGLIKTVLALKHKQIPPTLHFKKANPKIGFSGSPFFVNTMLRDWKNDRYPLRAGVSSFGIGGTNVHLILEEAPQLPVPEPPAQQEQLLVLTGKTAGALERNAAALRQWLLQHPDVSLADVAYTLQTGRAEFNWRKAIVCNDIPAAAELLAADNFTGSECNAQQIPQPVWMFPGQGAQYAGMCRDLYEKEKDFREPLDTCLGILTSLSGEDMAAVFFDPAKAHLVEETAYTQPLLFAVEYALAQLLTASGIRPAALIGHSIGEYVAACISGIFSLEDALHIVLRRGQLMQQAPEGKMLHIAAAENELRPLLAAYPALSPAAINSINSVVVSGENDVIADFKAAAEQAGHNCTYLRTTRAFHSAMMEPVLDAFGEVFRNVTFNPPAIPVISNLTGRPLSHQESSDPAYWVKHLRHTVRFSDGINTLLDNGHDVFVEVGPGRTLAAFVRNNARGAEKLTSVCMVRHVKEESTDTSFFLKALGALWMTGLQPNWQWLHPNHTARKISLPAYSFEQQRFPVHVNAARMVAAGNAALETSATGDLYRPVWATCEDRPALPANMAPAHLLIMPASALAALLNDQLTAGGQPCIRVNPASTFGEEDVRIFEEELVRVLQTLPAVQSLRIIYTGALDNEAGQGGNTDRLQHALYTCFYQLLHIAKAVNRAAVQLPVELITVSNGVHRVLKGDTVIPEKATLLAALKGIERENANISCRNIDLSPEQNEATLAALLEEEINATPAGPFTALRHHTRFVETLQPLTTALPKQKTFTDGGVYLITGATGGMGKTFAEKIVAEAAGVTLILLARTPLPQNNTTPTETQAQLLQHIAGLEMAGASVYYYNIPLTEEDSLQEVIAAAENRHGALKGVIHTAGVPDMGGIIYSRTREASEAVFAPKLYGTLALMRAVSPEKLDFFVLCSSMSRLYEPFGEVAYMAANAFLDAFAGWASVHFRANVTSICWNTWQVVGMAARASERKSRSHTFADSLTPDEGYRVLLKAIHARTPEVLVSKLKITDTDIRQMPGAAAEEPLPAETPDTTGLPVKNRLQALWEDFFGKKIGAADDFFEMGGDSLKAVTLLNRIQKQFGISIPIDRFFKQPTVNGIAGMIAGNTVQDDRAVILPAPLQPYYPATSAQQRLYFLFMFDRHSLAYNIPEIIRIKGKVDKTRMDAAFSRLIKRHESLRTIFLMKDHELFQQITEVPSFSLEYRRAAGEEEAADIARSMVRPFDLEKDTLFRAGLITWSPEDHVLVLDMHHIVADGISQTIMVRDFMALYKGDELPELVLQYKDFAVWRRSREISPEAVAHRSFWLSKFEELPVIAELPLDHPRSAAGDVSGGSLWTTLDVSLTAKLKAIAAATGSTLYMVMLSACSVLLSRLTNEEDVVIGTSLTSRSHADMEPVIGMFAETMALRSYPKGQQPFSAFVKTMREDVLACFDHPFYPYETLIDELKIERNASRNPLFDVMFSFQNFDKASLEIPGLTLTPFQGSQLLSKFDISFMVMEEAGALQLHMEYAERLFHPGTIARFMAYYQQILAVIAENPDTCLADIDMLPATEKQQLLQHFNNAWFDCPADETIISLFEKQVAVTPDLPAVIGDHYSLSYGQLNNAANQLARYMIREWDIKPHDLIGFILPKNENLIVCMLAILKTGAAYVPIDISYPDERIRYMVDNSGLKGLIIDADMQQRLTGIPTLVPETLAAELAAMDSANLLLDLHPDNPFYVIYTSGSSGLPKGVMIKTGPFVNLIRWYTDTLEITTDDRVLVVSPLSFDLTQKNIFVPLLNGAAVCVSEHIHLNYPEMADVIARHGVTIVNLAPSAFYPLLDTAVNDNYSKLQSLRKVALGGEQMHLKELEKWSRSPYFNATLINSYGPTECTDIAAFYVLTEQDLAGDAPVPVGRPSHNVCLYVLDRHGRLLPRGVAGEICIGGMGVSDGYINNPALTAEKFVTASFPGGGNIYRTGDLGKWTEDGYLRYLGRLDNQVKVRGNRIELQEIEVQLLKYEQVDATVVLLKEQYGEPMLVGYFTAPAEISAEALRAWLLQRLPEFMVPSCFMQLETFNYTPSGKIDRKALPEPAASGTAGYEPPAAPIEEKLVEIWAGILKMEPQHISVTANFFTIGGHSLRAIQLLAAIEREFGVRVQLPAFFAGPTVRLLHQLLLLAKVQDNSPAIQNITLI